MIALRDDGPPPVVEVEKPSLRTLLLRVRGKLDDAAITEFARIHPQSARRARGVPKPIDLIGVATVTSADVNYWNARELLHRLCQDRRVRGLHLVLVGTANPAVHRLLYLSRLPRSSTPDLPFRQRGIAHTPRV